MYSKIYTGAISGIDSLIATVEVDVSTGMPTFEMVGLLNHEVREAKERVKVALKNTGIEIPPKRITVSIIPIHFFFIRYLIFLFVTAEASLPQI